MGEPNLYDTEFPWADEVDIEAYVEHDFGADVGRVKPWRPLYNGIAWWNSWWRAAMYDPHHSY